VTSETPEPSRLVVRSGARDYPVLVGRGLLGEAAARVVAAAPEVRRWAVIADERVAPLYGAPVSAGLEALGRGGSMHVFPAGERHKTREEWARLGDRLLEAGLGRDGGVVAVGGGVTGDLAGFVAATFMRGIPVVQVPTSVVAMVDSAVGGKTGVDTPAGKNLVGAFHPPRLVLVDPEVVATLPRAERAQGWAEAVKHGAIADEVYFRALETSAADLMAGEADAVQSAVLRSVEIKAGVVGDDEHEAGLREILNFGHTLGHALEAASGYRLAHGSAVSLGMVLEARLGEGLGITTPGTAARLASVLERFELPTAPPPAASAAVLEGLLARDKKVRDGRVRVVLLEGIGRVAGAEPGAREVSPESLRDLLDGVVGSF
jgi:3-dehydroquinate synthase